MAFRLPTLLAVALLAFALFAAQGCARPADEAQATGRNAGARASDAARAGPSTVTKRTLGMKTNVPNLFRIDAPHLFELVRGEAKPLTMVNVWATWCGPCREELPMLAAVAKAYAPQGIVVLPVSVDDAAGEATIPTTLSDLGFPPPYYVVGGDLDPFKHAMHPGWRGNIPVSFVLDARAKRVYYFNAEVYENELTPVLDRLLAGATTEDQSHFKIMPATSF